MKTAKSNSYGRRTARFLRTPALAAALVAVAAACGIDSLLEVEDPTVAAPGTVSTEEAAPTTLAAAIGSFQLAYSGAPGGGSFIDSQITTSGTLTDEFHISESFPTRIDVDQRDTRFDNGTMLALYARLHTARRLAQFSADLHAEFPGTTNTAGHAHALNLAGFTYVLFGENYCSGVPFSGFDEVGAVDYGPPLSTEQIFGEAVALFNQALNAATAAGNADMANLARVGMGRAQLNLNDPAAAAATVADVPTDFVYRIFHSLGTSRQNNGIWGGNQNRRGISVSDSEGSTGLPYRSSADPRVPQRAGTGVQEVGFDNATPLFLQLKYPAQSSSVILASGVEARLIQAEAQLRTGGDWLGTLNTIRSTPPAYYPVADYPGIDGLAALTDPGSDAARTNLLFTERAYWMWLTSHRLGDQRRLMRQYGFSDAEAGFPTGAYFRGGTYGDHVSMLVPFDELNNPLFRDMFGEAGCDPSQP